MSEQRARFIAWGAYDTSKPRVRQLLEALRARRALAAEINVPVWQDVRDKAVESRSALLRRLVRQLIAYPRALLALWRQPRGQSLLLAYPAIPDIFVAWPVARLRGHRIVADAFISFYDTLVADRAMVRSGGLAARLIHAVEGWGLRLADVLLVDTDAHGDYFAAEFGIDRARFRTVLVGAEPAFWEARQLPLPAGLPEPLRSGAPTVLFYGQLIPLHGIDTILEAVRLTADDPFRWVLIGSGQDEAKLRRFLDSHQGGNVHWLPWLDYALLPAAIRASTVALGVFGTSGKAGRVVPNKAFQIVAAGRPLISRSGPALDPLAAAYPQAIRTVPPGDAEALADAVRAAVRDADEFQPVAAGAQSALGPEGGIEAMLAGR